jgi:D-alanyl-D-alanine carboxypeptidase (penicillin-binding protein 5/6)
MVRIILLLLVSIEIYAAPVIIPAPPKLAANGYLLIDASTGKVLVAHNGEQRLPPASLTKIMTSYVAAKQLALGTISLEDQVDISVEAWRMEGSRMFVREGTKVRLEDLIRGIVIQSGNDASVAVAEHIAGSESAFAELMNQYALQLGMTGTNYVNSTGLPDENHYTTAHDLALLTIALVSEFPEHYSIYKERSFTYGAPGEQPKRQSNRNKLLFRDSSVDGVKTGHTKAAGYCLVASALREEMRLISVVMGASSEEIRARESQKLLTYGFRYFETSSLYKADNVLKQVRVWGGQHSSIRLGLMEDLVLTIPRGSRKTLKTVIDIDDEVHAPLSMGDKLGTLTVRLSENEATSLPLVALNSVQASGFLASLWDSIRLFFLKLFNGDPLAYSP